VAIAARKLERVLQSRTHAHAACRR
jgi:hypothetical protein